MNYFNIRFLFLNVGHFLDHFFMLIFATAAALSLNHEWGLSYAELIPYATPGFIAFGVCAIPAGWLADKWSREGMMVIFFIGIGISSILAGMANSPIHIALGLALIGIFAAIYHPVGLAMVVQDHTKTGMPLAINGIFGNMGVACAALLTGYLIDTTGWRSAFFASGGLSIALGLAYLYFLRSENQKSRHRQDFAADNTVDNNSVVSRDKNEPSAIDKRTLIQIFAVIFFTTAVGGLIFQSTTFALPKVFEERLGDLASTATLVGWYSFLVFSVAAFAQLIVGYLVDHYSIRKVFASVALLQAIFFIIMIPLSGVSALLVAIAFMLVVFGQIPINDVLVGRITRSEWRSRAFALRYLITFSVMASTVPLIAWIHANWGFDRLFILLAVAASTIFVATLLLPNEKSLAIQRAAHTTTRTAA